MGGNNKKKRSKNKRNKHKKEKCVGESKNDQIADEETAEPSEDSLKRKYSDEDSDTEKAPRKKKKKQPMTTTSTDQKGKKSIRQMKRERHQQRQAEAQASAKDELKSQCISYLSQWKHDRQNWKFMKAKQVWLYKNKFSSNLVPDSSWQTFLEYFESAQGNIRNLLLEDANKVIKKMDEWIESQNTKEDKEKSEDDEKEKETDDPPVLEKPDDVSYKRARDLIQCLQE